MKSCVVVGGGICGLFSSIVLADKFDKVFLVEQNTECGGLLQSVKDNSGVYYDQGPHIPNITGVDQIDNILFGPKQVRDKNWFKIKNLKTGNYFNGNWDLTSQLADARSLPPNLYQKGLGELMARHTTSHATNLKSFLYETLGPTFSNKIVFPILRKLYGDKVDISSLVTDIDGNKFFLFGNQRIIATTPEITNQLKKLDVFDDKLGYHRKIDFENRLALDNQEEPSFLYPKDIKGIQFWVDYLISQAKAKNIKIITNKKVAEITHSANKITSIALANEKQKIPCDFLFWSAPPIFALAAAKITSRPASILFRTHNIFHFNFDKPPLNQQSHYLWNWDTKIPIFRINLLTNYRRITSDQMEFPVSIEVMSDRDNVGQINTEDILKDLVKMGVISKDTNCISHLKQIIHNTFPVPTFGYREAITNHRSILCNTFDNLILAGRYSGKHWLHSDVLKSAYLDIQSNCA